jgi:ferredoxin
MRISIDADKCVAVGVCALAAPEVFDQNEDDGVVVLLDATPGPEQYDAVQEAIIRCPAAVIRLEQQAEPGPLAEPVPHTGPEQSAESVQFSDPVQPTEPVQRGEGDGRA